MLNSQPKPPPPPTPVRPPLLEIREGLIGFIRDLFPARPA